MKKNNVNDSIKGFHLVEILVAIAMISIIAALSFPLYSQYVVQQRRLHAESILAKLAVAMEQYQLENNSYRNASLAKLHFNEFIAHHNYRLIIKSATDTGYLLIAKPINNQAKEDSACRSLTLNALGQKGMTGSSNLADCW